MIEHATIVHRPYPGEHQYNDPDGKCWCKPLVIAVDDPRTSEDILRAAMDLPKDLN